MQRTPIRLPSLTEQIKARWGRSHPDIRETILSEYLGLSGRTDVNECVDVFIIPRANKWGVRRVMLRTKGSYGNRTHIWWVSKDRNSIVVSSSKPSQPTLPAASMPKMERGKYFR
jgi:hypothetical protein